MISFNLIKQLDIINKLKTALEVCKQAAIPFQTLLIYLDWNHFRAD